MNDLNIPAAYLERMERLLGRDYPSFAACYRSPPRSGLRVNTLKIAVDAFQSLSPYHGSPLAWCDAGFEIGSEEQAGKHPYHAAGLYYLQEPSAMAVAEVLAPRPGERVLDIAAAPGGKATHLAAMLQGQGLLVANEVHARRVWDLAENLERSGVGNAVITQETPARLAAHFGPIFDGVLVDAPCSGEGMFRKSAPARADWSVELVSSCARRQRAILDDSSRLVRPGGRLVYSTCTFAPEENEQVIAGFLEANPDFELNACQPKPGFSFGRAEWLPDGFSKETSASIGRSLRIWPHQAPGEGHFIARLVRRAGYAPRTPPAPPVSISPADRALFQQFCDQALARRIDGRLARFGSYLYRLPEGLPGLAGLNVIHPGLWLGTFKKNRFEPAHALALNLESAQAQRKLDMQSDDHRVGAYLHGESIAGEIAAGWALVTVAGFALGWVKQGGERAKNYYPRGLRTY
jgi:NOL1/NOP2/sun family putative RNA methylase